MRKISATKSVHVRYITGRHKDYSNRKIRVLIVDDSQLIRKILRKFIESAQEFEVCGEAQDAYEAAFCDPHCLKMILDWRN